MCPLSCISFLSFCSLVHGLTAVIIMKRCCISRSAIRIVGPLVEGGTRPEELVHKRDKAVGGHISAYVQTPA